MIKNFTLLLFILLRTALLFAQDTIAHNDLLDVANENYRQVFTQPEEAFQKAALIRQQAQEEKNQEAELCAISTQCVYYDSKNNFEELMVTAKLLYQKAESYQNPVYQTSAKIDLFNAYAFSGLYDKAFEQLKHAEKIIRKAENEELMTILTRVNLFVAFSNYYFLQKDYKSQLKYLKLNAHEYEKLPEEKYKERFRYIDYSNRSRAFIDLKSIDSAEYYARLSLSKESGYERNDIQFSNFLVLGRVSTAKADFNNAVSYFKEAEKVKGYKNHLNLLILYENLIKAYTALDEHEIIRAYEVKRDSLKLDISENKNKSLLTILQEKQTDTTKQYLYLLVFFVVLMGVFMFFFIRKNRILLRQEKISREYLKENPENKSSEDYSKLLEMLKNNDPAFMPYFMEVYPDFTPKLNKKNPKLNQSDIDFCALLKLKIPTNDIAKYKFITIKSVQNKKYVIRKKLDIPKGVDIYNWFSLF
ncbi:MAG: hypothetical protein PHG67_03415 [Bacteroidales bacterium]|jgi:hypothetical protein|nr:hypothetical protein [Bacteroidales bacterium]MDY0086709.1 hypothetical protein [Bacteroidales bacterium]